MGRKIGAGLLFFLAVYTAVAGIALGAVYDGVPIINIGFGIAIFGIGLAVIKYKPGIPMLLTGIGVIIGGIGFIVFGEAANQDMMAVIQSGNPNPGTPLVNAGYFTIFVGIVILALRFWKKHQRP